jgi:TonB family protein
MASYYAQPRSPFPRSAWAWGASLLLHAAVVVGGGELALSKLHARTASTRSTSEAIVAVELPPMAESSLAASLLPRDCPDRIGARPILSGGPTVARIDTGRDGRGGERSVDRPATHLADVDERLRYEMSIPNRLDRDQAQRVRSDRTRAAREDRRSSREPMDLSFLSEGDLTRLERRTDAVRDPSRGVLAPAVASTAGSAIGAAPEEGEGLGGSPGGREGSSRDEPGVGGVHGGPPGADHRVPAAAAHARPAVTRAAPSVEAGVRGKVKDDVESEQELAAKVAALVHASTAGGVVARDGHGGEAGGGAAGALGVSGAGSHPTPLGDGSRDSLDSSSNDPRIVAYFRRFHAKVDPLWANAFPKSAMLDLKQGTVILSVTIDADGAAHVAWPPTRPSGVDEFDKNCADAVRRASPFDPIPPELGLRTLHLSVPFVATNPIVQ